MFVNYLQQDGVFVMFKMSSLLARYYWSKSVIEDLDIEDDDVRCYCPLLSNASATNQQTIRLKEKYNTFYSIYLWSFVFISFSQQALSTKVGTMSEEFNLDIGCPQGSILGPLFFISFINDIVLHLLHSRAIIYADDTTLICAEDTIEKLLKQSQFDFLQIANYFRLNGLAINASKTEYMLFGVKSNTDYSLQLNDVTINRCTEFKFLGTFIDEKLNFNRHVSYLINRLSSVNYLLKHIRNYMDSVALKLVYYARFYSVLTYSILSWGPLLSSPQCEKIFKKQKQVVRIMYNQKFNAHSDPLFKRGQILKFNEIIELEIAKFNYLLKEKVLPDPIQQQFVFPTHSYFTRNSNTNVAKHSSRLMNKSLLCSCNSNWNMLSSELKNKGSMGSFKIATKQFLLNKY